MNGTTITLVVAGVVVVWLVALYNSLIRLRNRVREGWSDIDVQLKRRHDLIPNLVESAKGYMAHERQLLENITRERARAVSAEQSGDKAELAKAETALGGLLSNLRVAFEAYPDLKANQNIAQLMDELADAENKIQAARRFYNSMARDFNTKRESFPNNLFAKILNFAKFEFFEIEDAKERENVKVAL